jgi:hypothetical protein
MIPDWRDRMVQAELAAFILVALGNLFTFIGVLTPSWQVQHRAHPRFEEMMILIVKVAVSGRRGYRY